jgi:(R)-2-hydroxyacyl-CoA dehydratese activating ATPase
MSARMEMNYFMGIDIGSSASKVVIVDESGAIVTQKMTAFGTGTTGPARAVQEALSNAGKSLHDVTYTVVTGYGRVNFQEANEQISEISCHAKGGFQQIPSTRTIIDIGGQDMKVIQLNSRGNIGQFVMNDKCAAGTGRFLEVMARVLEIEVDNMGAIAEQAGKKVTISNTCTVFAESEVISQLASGAVIPDIVAGIHQSVARRAAGLALRLGITDDVTLTGGVARNAGVVKALCEELKRRINVPEWPQFTGALGAALFAGEKGRKQNQ